jgi:pyruvate carboxylase
MISSISLEAGQAIRKGDRLLVLEAMKMQSTIYANHDGKIKQILVQPGQRVETKDLLIVIE